MIAHRGSSLRAPENTMPAFALALEEGAEGLELDLQRTRDGIVVVLHDPTLDRTTDGRGPVRAVSRIELDGLDAAYHFLDPHGRPAFRGHAVRVPTLEEVLIRFPSTWLSLDLKQGDPLTEERTIELLRHHRAQERVVIGAEDAAAASRLRAAAPDFVHFFDRRSAWWFLLRHRLHVLRGYRPPARSLQIPVRHRSLHFDTARLVREAHALGLAVRYWTVNDEPTMERIVDLGADGIITDDPGRLRRVLERKGLR